MSRVSDIVSGLFYVLIVRLFLNPILRFSSFVHRLIIGPKPSQTVEMLKLFYHQMPSKTTFQLLTQPNLNFIFHHSHFADTNELQDPRWHLDGFDKTHAYFILLPNPIDQYQARSVSFLHQIVVDEAVGLARMQFEDFCKFSEQLDSHLDRTVLISHMPRAGSTLLAQMLQLPGVCSFSEPDAFSHVSWLHFRGLIDRPTYERLLKATFAVLSKNQLPSETYVFKLQSPATYIVPDVIRLLPAVKNVFISRGVEACLLSTVRFSSSCYSAAGYMRIMRFSPFLAGYYQSFNHFFYPQLSLVRASDLIDYCYVYMVYPLTVISDLKCLEKITFLTYEQVLCDPSRTMRRLFRVLNICEKWVPLAVEALKVDSQEGTVFSQENMALVSVEGLGSKDRIERFREIDEILIDISNTAAMIEARAI